jgi:hypothetical protein
MSSWDQANRAENLVCFGEIERKLAKLSMTTFTHRSSSLLFYGTKELKLCTVRLFLWAFGAGIRNFYPALAALVSQVQNIFFPPHTLFPFMCPHRPASWSGRRAWSPVQLLLTTHKKSKEYLQTPRREHFSFPTHKIIF